MAAELALSDEGLIRPENRMDWLWDHSRCDKRQGAGAPIMETEIFAVAASKSLEGGGAPEEAAVAGFLDGVLSSGSGRACRSGEQSTLPLASFNSDKWNVILCVTQLIDGFLRCNQEYPRTAEVE